MTRILRLAAALAFALGSSWGAAVGCGSEESEQAAADSDDDALRAAAIAREIRAAPDDTEAILERHDLTIEQFEALMYQIAGDPEASARYEAALAE